MTLGYDRGYVLQTPLLSSKMALSGITNLLSAVSSGTKATLYKVGSIDWPQIRLEVRHLRLSGVGCKYGFLSMWIVVEKNVFRSPNPWFDSNYSQNEIALAAILNNFQIPAVVLRNTMAPRQPTDI